MTTTTTHQSMIVGIVQLSCQCISDHYQSKTIDLTKVTTSLAIAMPMFYGPRDGPRIEVTTRPSGLMTRQMPVTQEPLQTTKMPSSIGDFLFLKSINTLRFS